MNYQQFVITLKEKVKLALGESLNVEIMTTLKNNGTERVGLSISDPMINISPTIYLEELFDSYQHFLSIEEIVSHVVDLYHEVRFEQNLEIDDIQNFSYVQNKIAYKLINRDQNEKLLRKLPHLDFFEFALVFFMFFDISPDNRGTITVTENLLNLWQVNLGELYELAQENMPKLLPATFMPMQEMVCEMLHEEQIDALDDNPLYVLTNKHRTLGASTLLYRGMLSKIACHLKENFYILPSSIHELIIIPESRSPKRDELDNMIKEINATQVGPEEILGERSYHYDITSKTLR